MTQLVTNQIRTPDGTVLTSYHRHDYKTYDDANGNTYMIDGGLDYVRYAGPKDALPEMMQVYANDPHSKIREGCFWGTYNKKKSSPLQYKALKDLSTSHIKAILNTQTLPLWRIKIFNTELLHRSSS